MHRRAHTIVSLHAGAYPAAIADTLYSKGIAIETTHDTYYGPAEPGLTIGYGLADTDQLEHAVALLGRSLARRGPRAAAPGSDR